MTHRPPVWFPAEDVLSGRVQLSAYPLPFVVIRTNAIGYEAAIEACFAVAYVLETQGWQVVNFTGDGTSVFLRRPYRPAPVPPHPGQ